MAKPRDMVHLVKQEYVSEGGDAADESEDFGECPVEPNEDGIAVQGVFLQPPLPATTTDEDVYIGRDAAGNMCFADQNQPEISLSALAVAGLPPLERFLFTEDLCIIVVGCDFVENC